MATTAPVAPPAVTGSREIKRVRTIVNGYGKDIKSIRDKGLSALSKPEDRAGFKGMLRSLDAIYNKFCDKWDEIGRLCDSNEPPIDFPTNQETAYFEQIKACYFDAHGYSVQLEELDSRIHDANATALNASLSTSTASRTILPRIKIPDFDGDFTQWPTFCQLFTSLIINETSITDSEKFQYLISYLTGPALSYIRHIAVDGNNFKLAWKSLSSYYDNKRKLASVYLDNILSFKCTTSRPSAESLQSFLSNVCESVSALLTLEIPSLGEYILCELALKGLDAKSREDFEIDNLGTLFPSCTALRKFVQDRFAVSRLTCREAPLREPSAMRTPHKSYKTPNSFAAPQHRSHALMAQSARESNRKHAASSNSNKDSTPDSSVRSCFICNSPHTLIDCPKFKLATPAGRLNLLKRFPGCRLCFHIKHKTRECSAHFRCAECGNRHNTYLHLPVPSGQAGSSSKEPVDIARPALQSNISPGPSTSFVGTNTSPSPSAVLLGTVLANVLDSRGTCHTLRGVLDPGSQFSFLVESCAKKLELPTRDFYGSITGVNQSPLANTLGVVKLKLVPIASFGNKPFETEAVVVPTITLPLPQSKLDFDWTEYFSLPISDPNFFTPGPIHFLIGADLYPEVVTGAPITVRASGPKLIETVFGFTVVGKLENSQSARGGVGLMCAAKDPIFALEQFWKLEEPSDVCSQSPHDLACEEHFKLTHYRESNGRYVVTLPFLNDPPNIAPNIKRVISRFEALERKFSTDETFYRDYSKFMSEYVELGHMAVATQPPLYLIPHHGVYKYDNEGNGKLRVVFDASFRTHTGSLNDHLHAGPKLQLDIGSIMLNFRIFRFVLSCDIVKMFRQILVNPKDWAYQQIVWRPAPTEPLRFFSLRTVTYGLRSSPFQAQRVLHQLVSDEGNDFPMAAEAILSSAYIDDIVSGADSVSALVDLRDQLISLLGRGGFQLGKWKSNCPELLDTAPNCQPPLQFAEEGVASILGMQWCPLSDSFSYRIDTLPSGFTKRTILSAIARLYDPLGFLAPVVFQAKCVLQETWKIMLDWDDKVPEHIHEVWKRFLEELPLLSHIRIARPLPVWTEPPELVCFSDASERGYCATVYIRTSDLAGNTAMTLVKAKTRLAPLKALTIPRLELCGALLLSQVLSSLDHFIKKTRIARIYCFTDSTVVVSWLNTPVYRLQTFVANRVQSILDLTDLRFWYHVKGADNPADVGSRGIFPSGLEHHELWWCGPTWCTLPFDQWPVSAEKIAPEELPELRTAPVSMFTNSKDDTFIKFSERYSTYLRLVRVVAYTRRFVWNCRAGCTHQSEKRSGPLDALEIDDARKNVIRSVQHFYFPQVYRMKFDDLSLELRRLSVFIDNEQLIRVGGRLANSGLSHDQKFPLLLPTKSHLTDLIITYLHKKHHHVGPSTLLAFLRHQYWIPKGKSRVKAVLVKCVLCTRYARAPQPPFMGNLPRSRFESSRAFTNTGVDFAGPFRCKPTVGRSKINYKVYLCLYICLSSRAIHLELVTSLTVEAFLNSFDRFVSLYGVPAHMYSDCGTNFVGAARYLEEVRDMMHNKDVQDAIVNHTSDSAIQWHFNPPRAPHFGGSWEAGVRSVKGLLRKTFSDVSYTEEELSTVFAKIAGILNSRPLQPVSDHVEDLEPLTPGHLLIGQPLTALPEPDFQDVALSRLNRWQLIRQKLQYFWSRWKDEYLSSLQTRQTWCKRVPNLRINDLVLISDQRSSPQHWPMARVVELHPGADQTVRVVTVRSAKGVYKRPVTGLVPLPVLTD